MADYLVIVESPTKAKTIRNYLGKKYKVKASMGHVLDLPKSQFGIDVDNDFKPKYITIRGKGGTLKELKDAGRDAKKIFLAADPDREGEAICWHLTHVLGIDEKEPCRVEFNEITDNAIKAAFKNPRPIDRHRVDAQQARRVLDRIVGYKISPLLWKKIKKGLSAGRVQSVALRLIVERENEIASFIPEEYWSITALLDTGEARFEARYYGMDGRKHVPANAAEAEAVAAEARRHDFVVKDVKIKERRRNPAPPFTTSSLQQEASRKLGFAARRTMQVAQQLYEGLPLGKGEGVVGLITYMRTDSTRIARAAQDEARSYIEKTFGATFVPEKPHVFAARKGAQEAHEAIRPTSVARSPERLKNVLSRDQYRLYNLIFNRFLASQMSAAVYDTVSADIEAGRYLFRATGSRIKFEGFMKLYIEGRDEEEKEEGGLLPELAAGQLLTLADLKKEQHFTQPPPRFSEASLVKTLEEKGIGRPSTYAPIVETLLARGYVIREKKLFFPTELGRLVLEQLLEFFPDILDVDFTAQMEEELDGIAEGKQDWVEVIRRFYSGFARSLKTAEEHMEKVVIVPEESDEPCPRCGRQLVYKMGRYGRFLACPGFPECRFTRPILKELDVACPECGKVLVERKTKRQRKFYGCSGYPECGFTSWDEPQKEKCRDCGYPLVKKGKTLCCANRNCVAYNEGESGRETTARRKKTAARAEKRVAPKSDGRMKSG